jgi:hypothetical protein
MAIRATFAAASSGVLNIEHDLKATKASRAQCMPKPHIDVVIRLFS